VTRNSVIGVQNSAELLGGSAHIRSGWVTRIFHALVYWMNRKRGTSVWPITTTKEVVGGRDGHFLFPLGDHLKVALEDPTDSSWGSSESCPRGSLMILWTLSERIQGAPLKVAQEDHWGSSESCLSVLWKLPKRIPGDPQKLAQEYWWWSSESCLRGFLRVL
jgi:hypothetical protein